MLRAGWRKCNLNPPGRSLKVAAAHTWQFLSSKVNNTSLLSSKESEKLLKLMKESFREDIKPKSSGDSKNLAEHHFSSLLANPIFANPASKLHAPKDPRKEPLKVSKKTFSSFAMNQTGQREGCQREKVITAHTTPLTNQQHWKVQHSNTIVENEVLKQDSNIKSSGAGNRVLGFGLGTELSLRKSWPFFTTALPCSRFIDCIV